MKRKLEVSELIFKIISYVFLTIFALACLYPLVYAFSSAISGEAVVDSNEIILLPKDIQFEAFRYVFNDNVFWTSYSNTLFITFFGTIWALGVAILGGYALSKKRLLFRRGFNFFLVFTMWFSAGMVPQWINYKNTENVFNALAGGNLDNKWLIVIAMGMAAMNVILLRNAFEGVPSEIEEASIVDGATELQVLTKVYIPMSKSTIATVALFFGISRWNGYYWAQQFTETPEWPLQVYLRSNINAYLLGSSDNRFIVPDGYGAFSVNSFIYAMIICAIIPILVIYPFIQKYFAKGVNMGGVKE